LTLAPQPRFGVTMVGPVMIAFGSEEQKKVSPRLPTSTIVVQGFRSPAPVPLASLRTREGDGALIVNGQKT
jgi:alkylation response protein AidB-like acyl-CoA dehydrogenase